MKDRISVVLQEQELDLQACYNFVQAPDCGGISVFVGTVRNHTAGKEVKRLDFSAYEPMAIKEMTKIAQKAIDDFKIEKIAIHHGLGSMSIGEIPVIIAVASAHRKKAFEACQFAIDTLKETVPIWKKEYFQDGEVWVNAHP